MKDGGDKVEDIHSDTGDLTTGLFLHRTLAQTKV